MPPAVPVSFSIRARVQPDSSIRYQFAQFGLGKNIYGNIQHTENAFVAFRRTRPVAYLDQCVGPPCALLLTPFPIYPASSSSLLFRSTLLVGDQVHMVASTSNIDKFVTSIEVSEKQSHWSSAAHARNCWRGIREQPSSAISEYFILAQETIGMTLLRQGLRYSTAIRSSTSRGSRAPSQSGRRKQRCATNDRL